MKTTLSIILILFALNCQAIDKSVYIGGWSEHSHWSDATENQQTKGVRIGRLNYIEFINSFGNPGRAVFVSPTMVQFTESDAYDLRFDLNIGLVYGYAQSPIPFLLPNFRCCLYSLCGNLIAIFGEAETGELGYIILIFAEWRF